MKQRNIWLAGILAASGLVTGAFASVPAVTSHVSAYKVDKDGHIERIHGAAVRGEKIEYRVTYTNLSHRSIRNLPATLTVPGGLILVEAKNAPSPSASLDGRKFRKLALIGAEFSTAGAPVAAERNAHYRALRWNVSYLAPGRTQVVYAVFRVAK